MYCSEGPNHAGHHRFRALLVVSVLLNGAAFADAGDFVIGAGVEGDSLDGVALSMLGDIALSDDTWLAASVAHSGVDLPRQQRIDYLHASVTADHFADPLGIRLGAAYWGDSDILDSADLHGAVYFNADSSSLAFDAEYREFNFSLPPRDLRPRAEVDFDASGFGLSGRIDIGEQASAWASGMAYQYSREFDLGDAVQVTDVLAFSRFSVLNSLVDWRANAGIGIDAGLRRWELDVSRWRGVVDASDNVGVTLSFLTPVSERSDVELSLGYDDSSLYGDVLFLSAFLYFYGGN